METLAAMTGDVDAEVAILARGLTSAWQYVRIINAYRDADRHGDALEWGERTLAAFDLADVRLVEDLAVEYHYAGRGDDARLRPWARKISPRITAGIATVATTPQSRHGPIGLQASPPRGSRTQHRHVVALGSVST